MKIVVSIKIRFILFFLGAVSIGVNGQFSPDYYLDKLESQDFPLLFEKNEGQLHEKIKFEATDKQARYWFLENGFRAVLQDAAQQKAFAYDLTFVDMSEQVRIVSSNPTENPQTGRLNYIFGEKEAIRDVPFYQEIQYQHVWQGIEVHFHDSEEGMKYDFMVSPGANPADIKFKLEGLQDLKVTAAGELTFSTPLGELRKGRPLTWQVIDGEKVFVDCAYVLKGNQVSFKTGSYHPDYPLIIDPVALKFSTFLGNGKAAMGALNMTYKNGKLYFVGFWYYAYNQFIPFSIDNLLVTDPITSTVETRPFIMCMEADGSKVDWFTLVSIPFGGRAEDLAVNEAGDVFFLMSMSKDKIPDGYDFSAISSSVPGVQQGAAVEAGLALIRLGSDGSEVKYFSYVQPYPVENEGWKYNDFGSSPFATNAESQYAYAIASSMVVEGEDEVVFCAKWKRSGLNLSSDPIAFIPAGTYYHSLGDKSPTSGLVSSIFKLDTSVDGPAGVLSAAFLEDVNVNHVVTGADKRLYVAGTTLTNLYLDFITGEIVDRESIINVNSTNTNQTFVTVFDSTLSNPVFGTIMTLNNLHTSFGSRYPVIRTDLENNIYLIESYSISFSNWQNSQSEDNFFSEPSYWPADKLIVNDDIYFNGNYVFNALTKLPVSNYLKPEFISVTGNVESSNQNNFLVDSDGNFHCLSQARSLTFASRPKTTPGAFQNLTRAEASTQAIIGNYQRLNSSGEVVYSTHIGQEFHSSRVSCASLAMDESTNTVFTAISHANTDYQAFATGVSFDPSAIGSYPLTKSYRDPQTGKKVNVFGSNKQGNEIAIYLAAFHTPEIGENRIDTFPAGENVFCPGSLIGLGDASTPLTGSAPVYISGDGSDSTHNLPLLFVKGVPVPHPTPKSPLLYFQWQKSTDGGLSWVDIPDADNRDYIPEPELFPDTIQFRRRLIDGRDTSYSNTTTVFIEGASLSLDINGTEDPIYFCPGSPISFDIQITGAIEPIEWAWYSGFSPIPSGIIAPQSGSGTLSAFSAGTDVNITVDNGGLYRLVVSDATGCKKEFFVTLVPLTESIYPSSSIKFCPGEGGALLGPPAVNPTFDYQITGPSSFSINEPNYFVSDASSGVYNLQIKLKEDTAFCVAGQTSVTLEAMTPHDTLLVQLNDVHFCQTDTVMAIGIAGSRPLGYSYSWLPRLASSNSGLSDFKAFNPTFDPDPRPYGVLPVDVVQMEFQAKRTSDGCVFKSNFILTDTASGNLDVPSEVTLQSCNASFAVFPNKLALGTYFKWEVISTTFPGGRAALLDSPDFGFNQAGTDTATSSGVTLFYPAGAYEIVLGAYAGYFPIGTVACEAFQQIEVTLTCGTLPGFACLEISGDAGQSGFQGACGDTVNLYAHDYTWVNSNWYVTEVDGVAQPANSAPKGLFEKINNNYVPLGTGGSHPTSVTAIADNGNWGFPGTERVKYIFKGTYYQTAGDLRTCIDTVTVFNPRTIPDFGINSVMACNFPGPGTLVSADKAIPYTLTADDYATYPPSGNYYYNWSLANGSRANETVSDTTSLEPVFTPDKTTLYRLTVKDTLTGCSASELFEMQVQEAWVSAGADLNNICPGSIIQLNGSAPGGFSYKWTPSIGTYFPTPDKPNDTVSSPFFVFPNTTGIDLKLTATNSTFNCVVAEEIQLVSSDAGPDPQTDLTYEGCPYAVITIGPAAGYQANPDQTYQWTAGAGAQISWLSDPQVLNPTANLPEDFTGSAIFYLTITAGTCGSTSGTYTINAVEPAGVNQPATLQQNDCSNLLSLGTNLINESSPFGFNYSYYWFPPSNIYLSTGDPYINGKVKDVYPLPLEPTTYYLVVVHKTNGCFYYYPTEVSPPTGLEVNAGEDAYYCMGGDPVTLGETATGGTILWEAISFNENADGVPYNTDEVMLAKMMTWLDANNTETVSFSQTVPEAGVYKYRVTVDPGGCNLYDEVVVRVRYFQADFAGKDRTVCANTPFTLGETSLMSDVIFEWSIVSPSNPPNPLATPNAENPEFSIDGKHVFEVYYIDEFSGCERRDAVAYDIAPELVLEDIVADTSCQPLSGFDVSTLVSGYDTLNSIVWYQNAYPSGSIPAPATLQTSVTQTFFLEAANSFGCKDVAEVRIPVEIPAKPQMPTPLFLPLGQSTLDLNDFTPVYPSVSSGSFSWHTADPPLASNQLDTLIVGPGSYYLFETTPGGCVSPASLLEVFNLPPKLTATISPDTVSLFGKGTFTINILNPDIENSIASFDFTAVFPAGLKIIPGPVTNSCGGSIDTTGSISLQLTNGQVPPDSSCSVSVLVLGPVGKYTLSGTDLTVPGGFINGVLRDTLVITANGDYDGDGVDDQTEFNNGTDLENPCDPVQNPGYVGYNSSNLIWGAADCDSDSLLNKDEFANQADPYLSDTDGDGISDVNEVNNNNDPADPCSPSQIPGYSAYDNSNATWQNGDCDDDGLSNADELTEMTDPYLADSDGDGLSDSLEVNTAPPTDPLNPCDPSQNPGYTSYDSTSVIWQAADCDMDGLTNAVEDSLGTDPYNTDSDGDGTADGTEVTNSTDPANACDPVQNSGFTGYDGNNTVWQASDCDGDGVTNGTEAGNSNDPYDACDPSQNAGYTSYDSTNVLWQAADCDMDGLTNAVEDSLGTDPYNTDSDGDGTNDGTEVTNSTDPADACDPIQNAGFTGYDGTNTVWQGSDCDGDGVTNGTEAGNANDPYDACDPSQNAGYTSYDSTNIVWLAADCDMDGLTNGVEDSLGTDPYNTDSDGDGTNDGTEVTNSTDPADACDPIQNAGFTGYDGTNTVWQGSDCDGDGVTNGTEEGNSNDPYDACDPSQNAGYTSYDSTNVVWLAADCDMDGLTNGVEDSLGTDPYYGDSDGDGTADGTEVTNNTDPADACDPIQNAGFTGYDGTNTVWQGSDCDGDGVTNGTEEGNSNDPYDACDPSQNAGYTSYDSTNVVWQAADCDMDGLTNGVEDSLGTDPYKLDSDGDGTNDGAEVTNSTDPADACDPIQNAGFAGYDGTNTVWQGSDCDGDGVTNGTEADNSNDPYDACDPSQNAGYTSYDSTNVVWQAADCDMDGLTNAVEDSLGTDPYKLDSDGDGTNDGAEVTNNTDPADACDPIQNAGFTGYDGTNTVWQGSDCDGDGVTNGTEAGNSNDPYDACDPSQNAGYTSYDSTNVVWQAADCDMDGLTNGVEDSLGTDPYKLDSDGDGTNDGAEVTNGDDPADACDPERERGYTGYDSMNAVWSASDCDNDSLSNSEELNISTDPYNDDTDGDGLSDYKEVNDNVPTNPLLPCDPAQDAGYTAYDSTNQIWAAADCDMDGLTNGVEDSLKTDPYSVDTDGDGTSDFQEVTSMPATDPLDPCSPTADPGSSDYDSANSVWQTADCDGDGVDNGTEDTNSTDPFEPCSPSQMEGYIAFDSTNLVWQSSDCDGDGLSNKEELEVSTDPYKTDTDGDGLSDSLEVKSNPSTNPLSPCDPVQPASYTGYDLTNAYFLNSDCDGDGLTNGFEMTSTTVTDPFDPCDPMQMPGYEGYDPDNVLWAAADCDEDMILNSVEDSLTSDPYAVEPNIEVHGNDTLIPLGNTSFSPGDLTDFGSRNLNSVKRHRFRIKNVVPGANGPLLTGPMITITGGDGMFMVEFDQDCEVLPSGQSYLIIKYHPTVEGCHTATISIPHNDPNKVNPYTFEIQGKTKNAMCE